jgi:predicted component of type VI protein secretion system
MEPSTTTLASRSGWEACSSSPGSVISVTRLRTQVFRYDTADATANSRINARLPYIFLLSRIAHYLKSTTAG